MLETLHQAAVARIAVMAVLIVAAAIIALGRSRSRGYQSCRSRREGDEKLTHMTLLGREHEERITRAHLRSG